MRVLSSLVVVVLAASGCPSLLAPPTTQGTREGGTCSSSLWCAAGLTCECGVCTAPSGLPPRCPTLEDPCAGPRSSCYAACGDPTVVGTATCAEGRESCASSGGVLQADCPPETCWDIPSPGEVCVDGKLECADSPRAPNGQCYTSDCEGEPGACVSACADGSAPFPQACIASEWQCETGVPVATCGECVGTPPSCVLRCDALSPVGVAACTASREWSCAHIVDNGTPAAVISACCDENPAACPEVPSDGGSDSDGGASDAADADAGDADGGEPDGAEPDGGEPDDGEPGGGDGLDDGGVLVDGSTSDASEGDAG